MAITSADMMDLMREAGIPSKFVDNVKVDVSLHAQGLDSMDLPAIAVAVEEKYNLDLSDAEATKLKTINDFVAFVNEKL
jgi:acyl carrier protein